MGRRILLYLLSALSLLLVSAGDAHAVTTFTLNIPERAPMHPIRTVQLVLDIQRTTAAMGSSPTITLTNNGAVNTVFNFPPGTNSQIANTDEITRSSPTVPGGVFTTDITRHRFIMDLNSDSDGACNSNVDGAGETWTVTVSAGFDIVGACAISLWQPVCGVGSQMVNGDAAAGAPATITVPAGTPFAGACERFRPGLDVVMVLDRSGSMLSSTMGSTVGRPNRPKIEELRDAVSGFATLWADQRTLDAAGPFHPANVPVPADGVGVVLFQSNAAWWNPPLADGLVPFNNPTDPVPPIAANVNLITPGGSTSIGDGLVMAAGVLSSADASRRRVILLMSDGIQNTDRMVSINAANRIVTHAPGANPETAGVELPNQDNYDIYSVTVGTSTAVQPFINEQVALKTGGFYINTEQNAALLRPFFLELLQNFVKFNSHETVLMISGTTSGAPPFTRLTPITSTSATLSIVLMADPRAGRLRLTATPPGGGAPITQIGAGMIRINRRLPLPAPYDPSKPWTITVEALGSTAGPAAADVPFDLFVLTDDHGIDSVQGVAPGDHFAGAPIRLETRVDALGKPVKGLGGAAGGRVIAELVRPGVGIGDLLSDSNAPSTQPQPSDSSSDADAKLQNTLQANPELLVRSSDIITLRDDGGSASGDAVANDGVYSALYTPEIAGHYNFLFAVEGSTKETGAFSRQQLKTVYVRALPAAGATQVQTSVTGERGGVNTLVITMTPRTRFNHRLGPGFANYFWFTTPGRPAFKAVDNLNGTYTARMPFTGLIPPDVSLHFIDRPVLIDDQTTPDNLPVPLDGKTVVIDKIPRPGDGVTPRDFRRWGFSLHGGVSIPHSSNINSTHGAGPNFGADLEYRFNRTFSGELIYTYNRFRGDTVNLGFGPFTFTPLNLHVLSLNGKVYGNSAPVRPFFNFGGGVYVFSPGATARGGMNVGGGLQFDVTPNFAVDTMYNFHNVFVSGPDVRYSTAQGGVRFRF